MHEYSIVQSLLERVRSEAEQRGASRVSRLWMRVGELSGVEPELLRTAYETFREGSICAEAELLITAVATRWSCPRCERSCEAGSVLCCPTCQVPARLVQGDELFLDRIEMEVADV